jgi:Collagen triple helix repeat (20 copies)
MLTRVHQKLGTAGFVISIVALVVALGGGAYAASGGLSGKQKKEVEKIAKSVSKSGKTGATGPAGPAGAVGAKGDAGAKGDTGPAGAAGANGTNGTNGTNGKAGTNGKDGETGFTETLPSGKTETGVFALALSDLPAASGPVIPISFSIPLTEAGEAIYVNQSETENGTNPTCKGTVEHPTAPAGTLCVYAAEEGALTPEFRFNLTEAEYEPTGTVMRYFNPTAGGSVNTSGSYAVTAP